ncbi:MAG: helix-turn-helix domain-containing protein [Acidimicrobiales bacterium]
MEAREILLSARRGRGLSQDQLAASTGVPQPSVSTIEMGWRDTRVDTLNRLLAPLRGQVAWLPTTCSTAATAAMTVRDAIHGHPRADLVIELPILQLADDLASSPPALRAALCVAPPPTTGESRYDAAIAALVDYRLGQVGIEPPDWVNDEWRTTTPEWQVGGGPRSREFIRADTPPEFLSRGVLFSAADMVSV